jgi:hypothetical protein
MIELDERLLFLPYMHGNSTHRNRSHVTVMKGRRQSTSALIVNLTERCHMGALLRSHAFTKKPV